MPRRFRGNEGRRRRMAQRSFTRLRLEPLEDRRLLSATITGGGFGAPGSKDPLAGLNALAQEYQACAAQALPGPFASSNPLVQTTGDKVLIEAVASGSANALSADLQGL